MNDDLRDAFRAGLRCVLDAALWRALAAPALTPSSAMRAIGMTLAAVPVLLLATTAPMLALILLAAVFTWWMVPLAMRRAGAVIAEHALAAEPALVTGASLPLPEARRYRREWLPAQLCFIYLPALAATRSWGDQFWVLPLLVAMQAWSAPGAIVRTLLAPRFRRNAVDASLSSRRLFWGAVTLPWLFVLAELGRLGSWASANSLIAFAGTLSAWRTGAAGPEVFARFALCIGVALPVGVFATAALARFSGARMLQREGRLALRPELLVQPAPATPAPQPVARRARAQIQAWAHAHAGRVRVATIALAAALVGGYAARAPLVYIVLDHEQLPDYLSPVNWFQPQVRSRAGWYAACHGDAGDLRKMLHAGIVPDDFEHHDALGCAAYHGHVDAVKALVDAGHDIDALAPPIDMLPTATPLSPLQEALRTPAGLPAAEFLLAHGARLRVGGIDASQAAAAWGCLPCLEWLHQKGVPLDATAPATPLALWFDNPAERDRQGDNTLTNLLALGLSPTAIGADGRSALHAAAAAGNDAAVRLLLAKGADPGLADRDGMKPVFYAAASLRVSRDGIADTITQPHRMAVIADLLAVTPSLEGRATPAVARRGVVLVDPYIERPFDFGMAGAEHAEVRAATLEADVAIHYTDGAFMIGLPPGEARALLARMSDTDIATVMRHGSSLAQSAARQADWHDLARAARGWPRLDPAKTVFESGECVLLRLALEGTGDTSPGAADSWAVVDGWLATGMEVGHCDHLEAAVARRSVGQRADWKKRTR